MKDKSNGRERDYYQSKEQTTSPAREPETSTKAKGSPPRARLSKFESAPNREDQNHKRSGDPLSKESDDSSEARCSKKHKKSKKKKKSKDKDRHRESRSSEVDSDRATETKKKKKKKRRQRESEAEQNSPEAARSHKNRSSEERESRKRRYDDVKDTKHDSGFSPEKRRRTDHTHGGSNHLPSNQTSPSNGSTRHHFNGYTGTTGSSQSESSSKITKVLK